LRGWRGARTGQALQGGAYRPGRRGGSQALEERKEPEDLRADVEMEIGVDGHGRFGCYQGRRALDRAQGAVCAGMRRFLAAAVLGDGLDTLA